MVDSSASTVHLEAEALENGREQRVDLHAVPAPAVDDNLVKEIGGIQREETVGRVVQGNAVKGHPRNVVSLERGQQRQTVARRVPVARESDVLQVSVDLLGCVRRHAGHSLGRFRGACLASMVSGLYSVVRTR